MQSDAAQTEDTTLHVSLIVGSAPFAKMLKHVLTAINHSELQVEDSRWQCSICKNVEARPFLQVLYDQLSQVAAVPIAIDHVEVLSPQCCQTRGNNSSRSLSTFVVFPCTSKVQ